MKGENGHSSSSEAVAARQPLRTDFIVGFMLKDN
jgi:hypothetical protein